MKKQDIERIERTIKLLKADQSLLEDYLKTHSHVAIEKTFENEMIFDMEIAIQTLNKIKDYNSLLEINEFVKEVGENALMHGWWDGVTRSFGELIALGHSELSEALEEFRQGHTPAEVYYADNGKPEGIPIELADVIIRIFDMCHHYDIDIEKAIIEKHEFNKSRPYRHGGKVI